MITLSTTPKQRSQVFLGGLFEFKRDPLGFLERCAQQNGDIAEMRFLTVPFYFLNHPDWVEYVLVTNHRNFVKRSSGRLLDGVFGSGLFTTSGEFWLSQRRRTQPAFHHARIAAYADAMVTQTARMLATWHDGETRDLHREMMRLSLGIVARTLFGADSDADADDVENAVNVITERFCMEFPIPTSWKLLLPAWTPTPANRRFRTTVRRLDEIIYRIIKKREAETQHPNDLLSMLLEAQTDGKNPMRDRQLRDEVTTLLLTGHETSACALSWTWYLLSQHPEVERKLDDELHRELRQRLPTIEDISHMTYTKKVILESLRLYPPAWGMNRVALNDCEIGGRPVPSGASIAMSQWVMHRDPRYFDQPALFNPERWSDDFQKNLPKYAYFPFGGGPRLCIGKEFTLMEMALVIAAIAQKFRFRLVPGQKIEPEPSITLRPKAGVKVVLSAQIPPFIRLPERDSVA